MKKFYKEIWETLEKGIGRCFLYREAAIKETLGHSVYVLQFATFAHPAKIEEFLKNKVGEVKVESKDEKSYHLIFDSTRVIITCYETEEDIEVASKKILGQVLRCDNMSINSFGEFNRNTDGYYDIKNRELHFVDEKFVFSNALITRMLNLILQFDFTIGEDVISYIKNNRVFESADFRTVFCSVIASTLRRRKCQWVNIVEALKLVESFVDSPEKFIGYTAQLKHKENDDRFIRTYLYHLAIVLGLSAKNIESFMQNESTLQYFDSVATHIEDSLNDYNVYSKIKKQYGVEFLELLMDVQESVLNSMGLEYQRVSDETFDIGEMLVKDKRFWCSAEEFNASTEETHEKNSDAMDASKGNAGVWLDDKFNKKNYADEEAVEGKVYVDDDVEEEVEDSGIDTSAIDSYETGAAPKVENRDNATPVKEEPKRENNEVMNSQRGHESKVLDGGGM